jgi:ketosteroid isomerase-like protein
MSRSDVQAWLARYVSAWRANDPELIRDLFTVDAAYRYRPYGGDDHAARGIDAIVEAWLEEDDPPGSWEAEYEPYAVDGDRAVAVGSSRYLASETEPERRFHNVFLLRFADDGRCAEFTELYMVEEPG